MTALQPKAIKVLPRYQLQNQKLAVRDVYDAIVELMTNSDDRYCLLGTKGKIEVEVQRQRNGRPNIVRLRDFADGMTSVAMDHKLAEIGGRVSGLEDGESVRGTNSRGAKDVAALGKVRFESIAEDGRFHKCEIEGTQFYPFDPKSTTAAIRHDIGISRGTGTLVTIEIHASHSVPQHDKLVKRLSSLVCIRDILSNPDRSVTLLDCNQDRKAQLLPPHVNGKERVKQVLEIPGYPEAEAKLIILRANKAFSRELPRFRQGGILIKSRHAVHEATLFDSRLETDPHAAWFCGRLTCTYLDELWNDFDDRMEKGESPDPKNPFPVVDPMRTQGMMRDHPFVKALFGEALKRLRPLVEEERKRVEGQRAAVESRKTRKCLNKLQAAASEFMNEKQDDNDQVRDPDIKEKSAQLKEKGFSLNPPFRQLVVGDSAKFWLNVHQGTFPELPVGTDVQIQCLTDNDEIIADKRVCGLEQHPGQEDVVRAVWSVKAIKATSATGIRVRVGPIVEEVAIEVFESDAQRYAHITELMFNRNRYRVHADGKSKKNVTLMAPISVINEQTPFDLKCSSRQFKISGPRVLQLFPKLGIARCTFKVSSAKPDLSAHLSVKLAGSRAECEILSVSPDGSGISIKLEDVDLGNQRYRWRSNVLEIAARHPSLRRYLGAAGEQFPGQEEKHFLILLAEITADAVCSKIIERRESAGLYEEDECDFNFFSAEMGSLITEFAPLAHKLVVPNLGS